LIKKEKKNKNTNFIKTKKGIKHAGCLKNKISV